MGLNSYLNYSEFIFINMLAHHYPTNLTSIRKI